LIEVLSDSFVSIALVEFFWGLDFVSWSFLFFWSLYTLSSQTDSFSINLLSYPSGSSILNHTLSNMS
jgi:hypothetical protein